MPLRISEIFFLQNQKERYQAGINSFPQLRVLWTPDIVVIFQREEKTETKPPAALSSKAPQPKAINQVPINLVCEQQSVSSPLALIHHVLL